MHTPKEKDSGGNKGFCFIMYKSKEAAEKAVDNLNGADFKVRVESG